MQLHTSRFYVFCMLSIAIMQFSELLANTCDSRDVYDSIGDCIDKNVPDIAAPDGERRTASLIQARISAECGSRHNVTTCVENKFDYCPNKANILEVLGKRYRVCEADLPRPWITQWVRSNPSAKVTDACLDTLGIAAAERNLDIILYGCIDFNMDISNFSLNELTVWVEKYYSKYYTCLSEYYKELAPVIKMEPECVDVGKWTNVLTLITLTIQSQSPDLFALLPDDALAAVQENAAS